MKATENPTMYVCTDPDLPPVPFYGQTVGELADNLARNGYRLAASGNSGSLRFSKGSHSFLLIPPVNRPMCPDLSTLSEEPTHA